MSGEKPLFRPQVEGGHEALRGALDQMGLHYEETSGKYKDPERSYIIHNPTEDQMKQLGKLFGQESVVYSKNGQHKLVYTNGENEGKAHPAQAQTPVEHFEQPPQDFYTAVPGHGYMRINFDWNKLQEPAQKAEREFDLGTAALLAKNAVAQLLASQAPVKAHPHAYDWHDGHTDHHQEDLAGAQLPGLAKADVAHPTNAQAAPVGVDTYKKFALPYGNVQPGNASDLLHYKYHGKLPEIEKLVADHGFKAYYAGGKYGKPDLANKNYNTGHLMIYDPTPDSGANFGHEEYTRGWRQIHELAHALTYPELNKIYGEGRRMGKLGTHRTLNEALRAVHWEWLAAHKQRELSKQIGVHLSDQDFNKELNTIMHDAAHRAVTGKFTEPSGEGFVPHSHHVPLHQALQMVRDSAHEMGLKGMHETVKKSPMQKSLPLKSPAAAGVTRAPAAQPAAPAAAPALHNNLQSFHAALKQAGPPGSPAHTKLMAAHANHAPLLQDLGRYGQSGSKIVSAMNAAANSKANAGLGVGAKVTVKSEELDKGGGHGREPKTKAPAEPDPRKRTNFDRKPHNGSSRDRNLDPDDRVANSWANGVPAAHLGKSEPNLSKAEGDIPVAEKTYTAEEASQILKKATQEKLASFAKEIQVLRERELKKALIPPHKHNESAQASMAAEDVPPGKVNPKGLDKNIAGTAPSPGSMTNASPNSAMAMSEKCEKCSMSKKMCKCMSKADLVSENGTRIENHTVKGSKPPTPTKEVKRDGKGGSGGVVLPGSKLKRQSADGLYSKQDGKASDLVEKAEPQGKLGKNAAPPMAKPPSGKNMGTAVPTSAPKAPAMKAEPVAKTALAPGHGGVPVVAQFAHAPQVGGVNGQMLTQAIPKATLPVVPQTAPSANGHLLAQAIPKAPLPGGHPGGAAAVPPMAMKSEPIAKFAPSPGLAPPKPAAPAAPAGPKFGSQPGAPGLPPGAGFGASGHVITQAIPKPKLPGAGLKPAAPTGANTVAMKPPAMGKAEESMDQMEKGVDKLVVHGDKPVKPPKNADFTSAKQGDKAVYEAKKPDLEKAALPNQNAAAMAGRVGGGPDLIPSDPAPKPAAKPQYQHPNHAALAAGAKPLTPAQPKLGMASPKTAGATRAAGPLAAKPAAPAPALNAAKPAGAKPGIFGRLLGGK